MTDKLRTILVSKNTVPGAAGLLIVTLTLSNVLGLLRDRFLAATIPAGELDSYYAAFRLPDVLTNMIVVGAIAVAFVPLFTELRQRDERAAWSAAAAILNATLLVLILGAVLLIIFMPALMPLVVPDFSADKLAQTVRLARLLAFTPIFFGVSYLLSGVLNSFQRFAVTSLAPLAYNGSIIAATLMSNRWAEGERVFVVAAGVLLGAGLHMLIQIPLAASLGWRWQPLLSFRHPAVQKLGRLMLPRIIGLFGSQLATIVATAIASGWTGAITYFNLANNIQTMPVVVLANSLATAVFPSLATLAATRADEPFRAHLIHGIRWILFLLTPAAAGLIILRIQIVRLVLGSGYFGWEATQVTADVLGWFAIGLVAAGLVPLLARAFYARQNMKTPMEIALVAAVVTITLSYALPRILPAMIRLDPDHLIHLGEVAALAIAASVGMFINAGLLLLAARRTFALDGAEISRSVGKIIIATVVMAVVVQLVKLGLGSVINIDYAFGLMVQTVVAVAVGMAIYAAATAALGVTEWRELKNFLRRKTSTATSIARG